MLGESKMKMPIHARIFQARSAICCRSAVKNRISTMAAALSAATIFSTQSFAQALDVVSTNGPQLFGISLRSFEIAQFAVFAGSMIAALASALWLIRERGRVAAQNTALTAKLGIQTSRLNQLEALSAADGQQAIVWSKGDAKAAIVGALEKGSGAPTTRAHILAFGRWLEPSSATRLEHSIEELRTNAHPFNDVIETLNGTPLEVTGRTSGGSAIVRFANLSRERTAHAHLVSAHERVSRTTETLQSLMDRVDMPIWVRTADGRLSWVNQKFADAVECEDSDAVVEKHAELFGSQMLRSISVECNERGSFAGEVPTVIGGDRFLFNVVETTGPFGSAGLGIDKTEADAVRNEFHKTIRSHEETLDKLTTAVAMFDESEKLQFHNQAFAKLWSLDAVFLEQVPNVTMFLDRLRTEGQLPEQPEWRRWKDELLGAFRATETQEHWWHLPDGRTVRVVLNPHPKGGLTWVFENLTERIDLESRYKTMVQVQGETLDNLAEGVVVFGSDGMLQLANPAFEKFWDLDGVMQREGVHISDITDTVTARGNDLDTWQEFAGTITAFDEDRTSAVGQAEVNDRTLSWMIVPLPNGQTMITFVDITAADQIERALRDRNDALERTAHLRNRFIQHVSYELRSPLTSIMGFTDLLAMQQIGELNEKQREYIGHIEMSSQALLETTDDILDLASVDAGIMELNFEQVEIEPVMRDATAKIQDRMEELNIDLALRIAPDAGAIVADKIRLVQIMENVLSNAVDFAPESSTITFTCERMEDGVIFKVRDKGKGIDADALRNVFDRFHTEGAGRSRGPGLGLAIVKSFVDMHDGDVTINSTPDRGTEVAMKFPQTPSRVSVAAE